MDRIQKSVEDGRSLSDFQRKLQHLLLSGILMWLKNVVNMCLCLGVRTWFCQTVGSCFLLSIISHHVLSTFCLSQAHGSGGLEELHLLAESEPRCHRVRRAGLRYVQSASQTAVMGRRQSPPSSSPCCLWPFSPERLENPGWAPDHVLYSSSPAQHKENAEEKHFICIKATV